jgi:GNAT superfamily N-acetyltransferase
MPQLRFWQQSDLPHLARMSVASTWVITPEDDRAHTTLEKVAANACRALLGTLASPGGTAIVADEGGRPVGFLLVGIQPNEKTGEPAGYMADIWVDPEFRRHGLAEKMHYATEAYLKKLGVRRASNWTHAHNPKGLKSSRRHGFQPWGVMMSKVLK